MTTDPKLHTATWPTPYPVKHIIVEGPDGAGKSTLIGELSLRFDMPVQTKASTSEGGPVANLGEWVTWDTPNHEGKVKDRPTPVPFIYDRYPAISEPIYGPIVRGGAIPPFHNAAYLELIHHALYHSSVVVWCLPPFSTLWANVSNSDIPQMPGVVDNIEKVRRAYETAYFRWRGPKRLFDYTSTDKEAFIQQLHGMVTK